jgi:2,5-diketo-D-gluconate reductase A
MTPRADEIPTVTLNDGNTIPVLGIAVGDLPPGEAEQTVRAALDAGYRLIDAGAAGETQEAVGRAVAGLPREQLRVAARLAGADQGFQASQDACEAILLRLGLDHLDLCLVDWPVEQNGKYIDAWGGIMKTREVGRTRSIGVAHFTSEHLSNIIELSYVSPAINVVELHPLLTEAALRAEHRELGILTGAVCPLGTGTLLDHPAVAAVAAAHGRSAAQVLIRWSIQEGNVVFVRASDPAHLAEDLDAFGFDLTAEETATLNGLDDGTRFSAAPERR